MKRISLLAAGLCFSAAALASAADRVSVKDAYVRLPPPNAPASAAFMVIANGGDRDVRVVKAATPAARSAELHTHLDDNGVMRMRPVESIEVKAKGQTVLAPGGLHVMMIGLTAPLKVGQTVPITLTFGDGSSLPVEAVVRNTMGGGMSDMKGMKH